MARPWGKRDAQIVGPSLRRLRARQVSQCHEAKKYKRFQCFVENISNNYMEKQIKQTNACKLYFRSPRTCDDNSEKMKNIILYENTPRTNQSWSDFHLEPRQKNRTNMNNQYSQPPSIITRVGEPPHGFAMRTASARVSWVRVLDSYPDACHNKTCPKYKLQFASSSSYSIIQIGWGDIYHL